MHFCSPVIKCHHSRSNALFRFNTMKVLLFWWVDWKWLKHLPHGWRSQARAGCEHMNMYLYTMGEIFWPRYGSEQPYILRHQKLRFPTSSGVIERCDHRANRRASDPVLTSQLKPSWPHLKHDEHDRRSWHEKIFVAMWFSIFTMWGEGKKDFETTIDTAPQFSGSDLYYENDIWTHPQSF